MKKIPKRFTKRDKLILTGLYLSKFDVPGLKPLGFSSFVEAFNVIGFALGSKPASIKNYRDEFDPVFPNKRKGWHKRPMRDYCKQIYEKYKSFSLQEFSGMIKKLTYQNGEIDILEEKVLRKYGKPDEHSFAKRLLTGQAAENFFEINYHEIPEFKNFHLENTTKLGCGFDFKLTNDKDTNFLGIEVKGLFESFGAISLTPKEYNVADILKNRFYIFVVKNFKESPYFEFYQNPLESKLLFKKIERQVKQISWTANV